METDEYILAFDYGEKRIGIAIAHSIARLPRPVTTLANGATLMDDIAAIIQDEGVQRLVVGLPRNMDGSLGKQAEHCEAFGANLAARFNLPVDFVDETLSSVSADTYVHTIKGKSVGLDAVAAAVILERFMHEKARQ